jgi:molybdate transport system permease protein
LLSPDQWQAIRLTLLVSATAVVASLPLAILLGWILAKRQFAGKFLVETLINLPLVLPPVVTGYLLLVVFGRQGPLGSILENTFGVRLVFDWKGAALAAAVVAFPLLIRPIRQAFAAIDDRLIQAARTLGARPLDAFRSIVLPLARPGILSGCALAFARSMGEFGATIMIAGSIPGQTRTISLEIYNLLDSPGGAAEARTLVLVSILVAAAAMIVGEVLERRGQQRAASGGP